MDEKSEGYPQVRPINEVLLEMEGVAMACEGDDAMTKAAKLFERALQLALEIRVPRMPDSDEELRVMLERGRDGPTYTGEEVEEHLAASRQRFGKRHRLYQEAAVHGYLVDAANMLLPDEDDTIIRWETPFHLWTIGENAKATVVVEHRQSSVSCVSAHCGLAMLGAIMRAHAWQDTWKR